MIKFIQFWVIPPYTPYEVSERRLFAEWGIYRNNKWDLIRYYVRKVRYSYYYTASLNYLKKDFLELLLFIVVIDLIFFFLFLLFISIISPSQLLFLLNWFYFITAFSIIVIKYIISQIFLLIKFILLKFIKFCLHQFFYVYYKIGYYLMPDFLPIFLKGKKLAKVWVFFELYLVIRCQHLLLIFAIMSISSLVWFSYNEARVPMRVEAKNPWVLNYITLPLAGTQEDPTKASLEEKIEAMLVLAPKSVTDFLKKFGEFTLVFWSTTLLLFFHLVTVHCIYTFNMHSMMLSLTDYILVHQFAFILVVISDPRESYSSNFFKSLISFKERIPMKGKANYEAPLRYHMFRQICWGYLLIYILGLSCHPISPFTRKFYLPARKLGLGYFFPDVHIYMLILCFLVFFLRWLYVRCYKYVELKRSILLLPERSMRRFMNVATKFVLKTECFYRYKTDFSYICLRPESELWKFTEIDIVLTVKRYKRIKIIDLR